MNRKGTGDIGMYYVLCRLVEEGFLAALAPRANTQTIDIFASTKEGLPASIHVKTKNVGNNNWHLTKRHGDLTTPGLFYTLVALEEAGRHTVFVLPSEEMSRVVQDSYTSWITTPPATPLRPKTPNEKPGAMRLIYDPFPPPFGEVPGCPPGWMEEYRERWDLLRNTRL